MNFRNTVGYVTDISPDDFQGPSIDTADYPRTTPQGNSVGFEDTGGGREGRDRNASNDAELAGLVFSTVADTVYRIDLPSAGSYSIRTAAGDPNYVQTTQLTLKDGGSVLQALSQTNTTAANKFRDATDAEWSAATFVANNVPVVAAFATTICRFLITGSSNCSLAHVYIQSATAPVPVLVFNRMIG